MILFFIYTHDNLQKLVKMETSLLAERRKKDMSDGTQQEMLQELVMDEEYDLLFKRYLNEAHAEIINVISPNYLSDTPTDLEPLYEEYPNFEQNMDFALWLNLHEDFPINYKKSIDIKLQQYLVDYICYRWLELKSPNDARSYYSRLEKTLDDIKGILFRRLRPIRRYPSFP